MSKERVPMDITQVYRCGPHRVYGLWNPDFFTDYTHSLSEKVINRIGVVLSLSNKKLMWQIISDGKVELSIQNKTYVSLDVSSILDVETSREDEVPEDISSWGVQGMLTGLESYPVLSRSTEITVPLVIRPRVDYRIRLNIPSELVEAIKLEEHDVLTAPMRSVRGARSFMRIGVRMVGEISRDIL